MTKMQFKKSAMAVAVVGALGGAVQVAQAVNLATDGLGEVLIFPYYTVNADYDTYVNVVNTSDKAVAVKVRAREAYNSRDCRDFNVVLSPYDVWVATITRNPDGFARITTNDNSCTSPKLFDNSVSGYTDLLPGVRGVDFTNADYIDRNEDAGPNGLDRCKAGYFEVIEMGVSDGGPIYDASKHNSSGVPKDCDFVATKFQTDIVSIQNEFAEPNNVLKGSGVLIRTTQGKNGAMDAVTLANFFNPAADGVDDDSPVDLIQTPDNVHPNLLDARPAVSRILNDQATHVQGFFVDGEWEFGEDAVSAVLMRASIINTWSSNPDNAAKTDWVITFPTKNFYVDERWTGLDPEDAYPPFANGFHGAEGQGKACDVVTLQWWDREEQTPGQSNCQDSGGCFSPKPAPNEAPSDALCYEANVLTFNGANTLGSPLARSVSIDYHYGWAKMQLDVGSSVSLDNDDVIGFIEPHGTHDLYYGLPAVGFAYTTLEDGFSGDYIKNYGSVWNHSYQRRLVSGQ